jgi:hypothetical protein
MSRSVTARSRWVSLVERSCSSFAFNCCVQVSPSLSLFRWCRWWLLVGTAGFWELDSILEPIAGVELLKEVFTSRARWMPLRRWDIRFRKYVLSFEEHSYLNLVILKLKCNNLIFNEILILYASYVCLLHSRFIENHSIWILNDEPLISEVILSQKQWSVLILQEGTTFLAFLYWLNGKDSAWMAG